LKSTGPIFEEPPIVSVVDGKPLERHTNDVCEAIDADNYLIDGKPIRFPVIVADASMMMNAFLVDAKAAQNMIQDSGFQVIELFPGKAILQLLFVDTEKMNWGITTKVLLSFPY
jgi:hypothetical protein